MRILALISIIGMMILAGCATDTVTTESPVEPSAASTAVVEIAANNFLPDEVTISAGGTVEWINLQEAKQKLVFHDSESRELGLGERHLKTFDEKGTYEYSSVNGAVGTVIVE